MIHNTNFRVESLSGPANKDSPPYLLYNKPFQNVLHEQQHEHRTPVHTPVTDAQRTKIVFNSSANTNVKENKISAAEDFPPIDHGSVDLDMRKELWKGIPKNNDWEKFSGELPYNHEF